MVLPVEIATTPAGRDTPSSRRVLIGACGAHALHDGFTDLLYVLLPLWQAEFGLGYAAIGALRALYSGTMAGLQMPATILARRFGGPTVLVAGTALARMSFLLAGAGAGFTVLALALVLGGVGSSTQHPIASSLIARAYQGSASRTALGTYNFAGDIGKMAIPAATAVMISFMPWRLSVEVIGLVGLAAAAAISLVLGGNPMRSGDATRSKLAETPTSDVDHSATRTETDWPRHGFPLLLAIGVVDSATRMGFLTFLPFLLRQKGGSLETVGLALTLIFAGGAAGKLVCGLLGARLGVLRTVMLTEGLTAFGILALLSLPLAGGLALLPLIGIALNGTSSVLYGTVPELVAPDRREHAFGIFYTGTIGAGAAAPILYGLFSDTVGVQTMMQLIALIVLGTLPLAWMLRPALRPGATG